MKLLTVTTIIDNRFEYNSKTTGTSNEINAGLRAVLPFLVFLVLLSLLLGFFSPSRTGS